MVCPAPGTVPHAPSSNGWRLGFKTELFPKDMGLALDIAHDTGASTILGQPVFDLFKAAGEDPRCRVQRKKIELIVGQRWFQYLDVSRKPSRSRMG
jgi:hypothetical protein